MDLLDELRSLGVNIDEGLQRINKNEKLYKRLLNSFVKAMDKYKIQLDFDAADCTEIIEKAHAIKGTAGNLSITPIYEAYMEIHSLLREGKPEEARTKLEKIFPVAENIVQCIKKYEE